MEGVIEKFRQRLVSFYSRCQKTPKRGFPDQAYEFSVKLFLNCIVVCAIASISLSAQSVGEIADSVIFARGGRSRMQSVQTEKMSGRVFNQDGEAGSFVMELKRPNKIRLEIDLGNRTVTKAYDGTTGWKISSPGQLTPQKTNESETKELIGEADIDGPFLDYDKKGTQIEILDKEMLGSSLVWKLKVTLKNKRIECLYVESTGYMVLLREELPEKSGQQSASRQFYRDFRRVDNIPFPFTIISETGDSEASIRLAFDKIEVNSPEDDSRFILKPAAAAKGK